jgi:hypothetical protein
MYPEDEEAKLRQKLVGYMGVPKDYLVVGNAGDELIDRMIRLFIEKGDVSVSFTPTFAIPRLVRKTSRRRIRISAAEKRLSVRCTLYAVFVLSKTRLLYLALQTIQHQPNETRRYRKLVKAFPGIVILTRHTANLLTTLCIPHPRVPNMIILRTFPKRSG